MEQWDLYDENRNKIGKVVNRGDKLADNEYHIVVNAWVINSKNEYLISQRAPTKSFPYKWECTGGSVLKDEDSIEGAMRELKEELGLTVDASTGVLIGSKKRYYVGCPDILDVWLFKSDVPCDKLILQKEEVCNARWASAEDIMELIKEGKFEANALLEEVFNYEKKTSFYYIGFNANNAICNESFFDGSISLYPNKEKGNIYYSDTFVKDTKSEEFLKKYKDYIYENAIKIQSETANARFFCFNPKIKKICSELKNINIIEDPIDDLTDFLNNKFETRKYVSNIVPTLNYIWLEGKDINYDEISKKLDSSRFVVQSVRGSGGDNTFLIESDDDMQKLIEKDGFYCISKYVKNTPLNATLILGSNKISFFPMSAQLILQKDHRFKYFGGDFAFIKGLQSEVIEKLEIYSQKIGEKLQKDGYRGILGIDYILTENNDIYFMEINPRFQSSSFLINIYLEKYNQTCLAEQHYLALNGDDLTDIRPFSIDKSFINCNKANSFDDYDNYELVLNGYFEDNPTSNYRKIFEGSILKDSKFEKIDR